MKSQKTLKNLFNQIFPSTQNKEKNPALIQSEFDQLLKSYPGNKIIFSIYCFFYPATTCKEQNTSDKFWFQKFQTQEKYTEYNVALDLLRILEDYLVNKDEKKAKDKFEEISYKLRDYKNVNFYLVITAKKAFDLLINLTSFFQQDKNYFEKAFGVEINFNDDLTDISTLENLFAGKIITKEEMSIHKYYNGMMKQQFELINQQNELINQQNEFKNQQNEFKNQQIAINKRQKEENDKLMNEINALKNKNKNIEEQLEQIHLRDTIKYSIKYIYRLFSSVHNVGEFESNVYEEMNQLKEILSNKNLSQYQYLIDFIKAVQYFDLNSLNNKAHPFIKDRNFDAIIKYVDNKKPYLYDVVKFLKKCPKLSDYINIEVNFFFSKEEKEKKINSLYDFNSIYKEMIKA